MSILKTTELKKIYGSGDTAVRALDGGRIDEAYITQIIETLGLSEKVNSLPTQLSGGQQQRVAIARALASKPAILLTTIMFTTLFTISGGVLDTIQEQTSRQVGTSAHAGFKYLTWEQYEKIASDPEVKDISYNIFIGFGENPEFSKMHTEIRSVEVKDAEWSFCTPTTGRMP